MLNYIKSSKFSFLHFIKPVSVIILTKRLFANADTWFKSQVFIHTLKKLIQLS